MEIISFFCKSLEVLIIGSTRILQGDTENENQAKLLVEDTKNQCEIYRYVLLNPHEQISGCHLLI